jgi:hypothetical protein
MKIRRRGLVCALATSFLASTAIAEEPAVPDDTFVPTLAVETGTYREELRVDIGDTTLAETRSLWVSRVTVGLQYGLPDSWPGAGRLRATTSIGIGLVYALGQWPLHFRQEAVYVRPVTGWLSLAAGLGVGSQINVSRLRRSYLEVGLPVGVVVADLVELTYYPMLTIGIAAEKRPVFGGTRSHSVHTGVAPLNFIARVRFNRLGF